MRSWVLVFPFRQMENNRVGSAPEEAKTPAMSDDLPFQIDRRQ
jgi:hypothetical protein